MLDKDNWILEGWQEWSQLLGGCNWYTFTPVKFEFEWDRMFGALELTVILLGLGARVRWTYAETEKAREIAETIAPYMEPSDE